MFFANMTSAVSEGTAALDLRGLGAQCTLVLVDGLRLGPGSADGRNWFGSTYRALGRYLFAQVSVQLGRQLCATVKLAAQVRPVAARMALLFGQS